MKKHLKLLSLLLGMALCTTTFVACGDDDDSPSGNNGNSGQTVVETDIAGTWKIDLQQTVNHGDGQAQNMAYKETVTFADGGTYTADFHSINDNWINHSRLEGTWMKLGSDRVEVTLKKRFTIDADNVSTQDNNFAERKDTLDYFFKGNALFCETTNYDSGGTFAYTRDGSLPYKGYGDYANNPILGVWVGEDFAWDGTPITNKLELRSDGTFFQTMDNHLGWSEGTAGYYILKNNSIMLISYYFISKMGSDTDDWEVQGFRMWGGQWADYTIDGDKLLNPGAENMSGGMDFMMREGTEAGTSVVGHWKRTIEFWNNNQSVVEDEYWELEANGIARHWWVRADGTLREGTSGTYTLREETNEADGTTVTALVLHWEYWLADSGDATDPNLGSPVSPEEQDCTLRYVYSKISDVLLVQWTNSSEFFRFKRIN